MIDKATKSDCKDIAKLAILMWGNHTLEELIEKFETVIQDKECAIFIVSVGDKKIGFAQCQLRHDYVEGTKTTPVGYLEGIFVKEVAQSKRIGKQLLDCAKEVKSTLRLSVYRKNEKAIKFYLREKFSIQSENVDDNTGEKEFVMVWNW